MKKPKDTLVLPTAKHVRIPWLNRVLGHSERTMARFLDQDFSSLMEFMEENDVPDEPFMIEGYPVVLTPEDAVGFILASTKAWWQPRRNVNTVRGYLARNNKVKLLKEFEAEVPRIMAAAPSCASHPPCPPGCKVPLSPSSPVDRALRELDCWVAGMPECYSCQLPGLAGHFLVPVHEILSSLRGHILRHTKHLKS